MRAEGGMSCDPREKDRAMEDGVLRSSCDAFGWCISAAFIGAGVEGWPEIATLAS